MVLKRDKLLEQMGITQYAVRRPQVFKGAIAITPPEKLRLLIISSAPPRSDEPLVGDILRTLGLTPEELFSITPEQVAMISIAQPCISWRIDNSTELPFAGVQLNTPALSELYNNAAAKRLLWQQICEHDNDLLTDPRSA